MREACFPRARERSTSFRSPRTRSTDRRRFSLSSRYPAGPLVHVAAPTLPRLIHYSAWLTANDFRYIRFSRGCTIAYRLSLSRDATPTAHSMVQRECSIRSTLASWKRDHSQDWTMRVAGVVYSGNTLYFAIIIKKVDLWRIFLRKIPRLWYVRRPFAIKMSLVNYYLKLITTPFFHTNQKLPLL